MGVKQWESHDSLYWFFLSDYIRGDKKQKRCLYQLTFVALQPIPKLSGLKEHLSFPMICGFAYSRLVQLRLDGPQWPHPHVWCVADWFIWERGVSAATACLCPAWCLSSQRASWDFSHGNLKVPRLCLHLLLSHWPRQIMAKSRLKGKRNGV